MSLRPWSREGLYWLLRFGQKNEGPWNYEAKEDEYLPDEDDTDLLMAAPDLLAALPDPDVLRHVGRMLLDARQVSMADQFSEWADRAEEAARKAMGENG